jgi:hypothetical protein
MTFTLTELPANITYTMQIPYGGVFDWSVWLPFFLVLFAWMGLVFFAERRKDVVLALLSLIMAFAIYTNSVSESVFVIGTYGISFIFALISLYEFFILALKYKAK